MSQPAQLETPAPNVHWGALAYPDQSPTLSGGLSLFRFTEFNGEGQRFNDMRETIGLNLITISWTEHLTKKFLELNTKGWSTNLTLGIGPTSDQPTRYLQNEFVHDAIFGIPEVPVAGVRNETDFMVSGALTRWFEFSSLSLKRIVYVGGGFSTGSLYHEVYGRMGIRRWSPMETIQVLAKLQHSIWGSVLKRLRLSGMVRYGRVWSGAAFRQLAPQSYVAQGSISYGWLTAEGLPLLELELGVTIDSGIFVDLRGDSIEERFWTAALRAHPFTIETWNDQLNRQDFGPTYGIRLMMELYPLLPNKWKWR